MIQNSIEFPSLAVDFDPNTVVRSKVKSKLSFRKKATGKKCASETASNVKIFPNLLGNPLIFESV